MSDSATTELNFRKAQLPDLPLIVNLLVEGDLGQTREQTSGNLNPQYRKAFELIDKDPNQFLMVVESKGEMVATCHLTLMPSLTFIGSTRLQIEAVRVTQRLRAAGIGQWMLRQAIEYGRQQGATIIQLATNKQRTDAIRFYETVGFESTHEGMKMVLERSEG